MSILDRERYLEMWMEGRRLFDMDRWNHPFITENWALMPRHQDSFIEDARTRFSCQLIGETECNLNGGLTSGCTR